ncbi:ATP-binding cassette domain-containing protein [Amycolatopsis dendrobii]|uniref:ATP-binding cassette domain-containing protein n=1 Tax=Amycolatopsis dendrobii TaxID=2760662 RepID=A0A7W3ZEZ5_9PSEU|nr:ATP-binding cassette domain-containing protein [Amycolatopsis dendrobii]MBB1158563.1 ATP-binding cassette domain-containing protein [Amycolatopsis dendrobii]
MITFRGLTKRYGQKTVVNGLTSVIETGTVTGFLGPNGAGKSTTMRMTVGLDRPDSGDALIRGKPYAELRFPLREVGALLDAKAMHPGRSAGKHLLAMARSNGIAASRVEEVLATVGLSDVAGKRTGTFSLGMSQRLGIAGALLGDPGVLMFDEPVNGLDPDGVRWVRQLMRSLAAEGRTVFVSSHLMSEMQLTADRLLVIGKGSILADAAIGDFIAGNSSRSVAVLVPDPAERAKLADWLRGNGRSVLPGEGSELLVDEATAAEIGDLAYELGVRLHGLAERTASLEQAYMELTAGSVEYGVTA